MSSLWRNNNVIKTKSKSYATRCYRSIPSPRKSGLQNLHRFHSRRFKYTTIRMNSIWIERYFRFTSGEAHHKVIHCPSLSIPFQNHLTVLLRGVMKMFRLEDPITVSVLGHLLSTLAHSYNRVMTPPVISNLNLAIADSISFWTNQEQFWRPIRSQFYILKNL